MSLLSRALKESNTETVRRDVVAALTVALFTVPQGMAYALIAGVPPVTGIWTAVAASILGALLGSSEFLINGPTNAMSVLIAANAALFMAHGDLRAMIVLATLIIGVGQLFAAGFKLGRFTRFVSESVLTGFTAGAGLYIAINQLPTALGLDKKAIPPDLFGWTPPAACAFDLLRAISGIAKTNPVALAIGGGTFVLVRLLQSAEKKIKRRIPAPFVAVVLAAITAYALGLGESGPHKLKMVRDIEPLTRALPSLVWPVFSWPDIVALAGPSLALAVLGSVEAIAIGKVLAARAGHPFDANRQLFGEGACNIAAALVGGFPSSGSFTRSAVNFDSGAATRLSCILSGVFLALIVLLFAPAANFIPVAALAGTLIHIGLKLVNVGKLKLAAQTTRSDLWVLAATFFGVLFTEHLQYALFLGIAVSIVQALRRAEGFKLLELIEDSGTLREKPLVPSACGEVVCIDLQGELFFAAADVLDARLQELLAGKTRFLVVRLAQAYNLDYTCAEVLANIARLARKKDGRLILSGVREGTQGTLKRSGVFEIIGADAVFLHHSEMLGSTASAIRYARSLAGAASTHAVG